MKVRFLLVAAIAALFTSGSAQNSPPGIDSISNIVVIFAENRSFDDLYGSFPGANGLKQAPPGSFTQVDRDGAALKEFPPVWQGLTAAGVTPPVTEAQSAHLPNQPFAIDDPQGFHQSLNIVTRDLVHRFYQNQMQIDGGKNDGFVAWGDSGALVMGHYDGSKLQMWNVARQYVLADNFFMGVFGSSFLNHFWLICACIPKYPQADQSPAKDQIAAVEADGVTLKVAPNSKKSAIDGPPRFVKDGNLTPDFYAVNTMQPPYQPSASKPAPGGDPAMADPANPSTLPPQTEQTIGDLLSAKGISWAWYGGAWQAALSGKNGRPIPNFQYHHQPFNYFASMAPGTAERAKHLKDGGLGGDRFMEAIKAGALEQVVFYKPQGNLNEHAGYADVQSGDAHIADLIVQLQKSPQWSHMVVIVTHDENGGFWDHVAPPKGDRWGPGIRIPAIVVSPFAKRGFVDHTAYDTTSILRLITKRFQLPVLPGIRSRDESVKANGGAPFGDLTNALTLSN
ncbi:MAG: acid phosphatase [Bryobacteraceae bacterium]|jgi:acid phosphatase